MENTEKNEQLSSDILKTIQDVGDYSREKSIQFLEACLSVEALSGLQSDDYVEGFTRAITLLKELNQDIKEKRDEE